MPTTRRTAFDELSPFKNYQSQRFKFLRKVRPFVKRWIGLTGTPTSNGLMDRWAEIGILDGGERLGRFTGRFRSQSQLCHITPIFVTYRIMDEWQPAIRF